MDAVISAAPVEVAIGGWGIPVGAPVYDAAGEKVGTDAGGDPYDLAVQRGFLFVHTYPLRLSDVERYEDGALHLKVTKDQVPSPSAGAPQHRP